MSDKTPTLPQTEPSPTWGQTLRVYLEPATVRMLFLGFSAGLPLLLVLGTLSFWLREAGIDRTTIGFFSLGRAGVRRQVGVGAAGGPVADSGAVAPAGAPARLAAAGAVAHRGRPGGHGTGRSAALARKRGVVRAGGGLRLGHAGHRARCLPHRIGRRETPGGAGGVVPDRLPAGHDLGRRRRAVDRRARRSRRARRATSRRPGRPPTW